MGGRRTVTRAARDINREFHRWNSVCSGSVDSSHTPVSTNEAYNPETNIWTKKASMPTARHHLTSEVVEGKLYAIGGRLLGNSIQSHINEALSNFNDNEVYDPKKDTWNIVAPMPTKRSGLAAASINGSIYLFGGQGLNSALNNTEKYDPQNQHMDKGITSSNCPSRPRSCKL
jgi:N-acetylneuraminic acid mutarotase